MGGVSREYPSSPAVALDGGRRSEGLGREETEARRSQRVLHRLVFAFYSINQSLSLFGDSFILGRCYALMACVGFQENFIKSVHFRISIFCPNGYVDRIIIQVVKANNSLML